MAGDLRVRIYNVLFGDAILLTIPEVGAGGEEVLVHVLIDLGNALAGKAGRDEVFAPVLRNIRDELAGAPLDLYVMTHEHMDHVQGLLFGAQNLGITLQARDVWMTASSEGDAYYADHPEARRKRLAALDAYEGVAAFLALNAVPVPPGIQGLLEINNPRATADCVSHISARGVGGKAPLYIHRGTDVDGRHPFRHTKVRLLAPEADTSIYYGALPPRTAGPLIEGAGLATLDPKAITPPAGVSAGHFFDLVKFRSSGLMANLRTIDKAANNSSVVIELEWNGWRLLFPGDAEEKSWEMMDRNGALRPVHFLKVSHHGSHNGTPRHQIDKVLPEQGDGRHRIAVVSTHEDAYSGVPDQTTLDFLAGRAELGDTRILAGGGWFDVLFSADPRASPRLVKGAPD